MSDKLSITINGNVHKVASGVSVLAALGDSGITITRASENGEFRAPLCGMGTCFECRVTINGRKHTRACMTEVEEGMEIVTCDQ